MQNYGKQFEQKFLQDIRQIPGVSVDRLYDQVSGYRSISNISDYIVYKYPEIFYMEVKSVHGNTFPLTNLTQYEKLKAKIGIKGVRAGVTIWFVDRDRVIYVPIETIVQMKKEDVKSVNIRTIDDTAYEFISIPSVKKRVFMDSDYHVLFRNTDYYDKDKS